MSFLRDFRSVKLGTDEWKKKQIVENVVGELSLRSDSGSRLWCRSNPCPINLLPGLYKDYVSQWPGVESDLIISIQSLWAVDGLEQWIALFPFFETVKTQDGMCLVYAPNAADVMVECYYQQHGFCVGFCDIEPSLFWNKCPVCGQVNCHERLKYSILCSATGELLSKWCSYFHGSKKSIAMRDAQDWVLCKCARCPYIDCPYSWAFTENNGNGKRKIGVVSSLLPQDSLARYAEFSSMSEMLKELSQVAEPEQWGSDFYSLRMYVFFTFYFQLLKKNQGGGLIETTHYSWFNTGLQTNVSAEDIFICFKPEQRGWVFCGITWNGSENGLYDKFRGVRGMVPEYMPPYESIGDLYFESKLDLNWLENFEHIYFDNLNRILTSKSFRNGLCGIDIPEHYKRQIDCHYDIRLPKRDADFVEEEKKSQFYNDVKQLFKDSIEMSLKRARRNYKWALPIYYPRNRSMSFALPLFLCREGKSKEPDMALVCSRRNENGLDYYDARTILEAYMIYQNARQVCKPYVEWVARLLEDDFVGRVISFDRGKLAGLIRSDSGRMLRFFAADNPCIAGIAKRGDAVKFEFKRQGKEWVAVNVRFTRAQEQMETAEQPTHSVGKITGLFAGFGFIKSEDGNKIFFPRNLNRMIYDKLSVGDRVSFDYVRNEKGYIASNVVLDCADVAMGDYSSPEAVERLKSRFRYVDN